MLERWYLNSLRECTANLDLVKSLGADVMIDYKKDDFEKILHDYDVVLKNLYEC